MKHRPVGEQSIERVTHEPLVMYCCLHHAVALLPSSSVFRPCCARFTWQQNMCVQHVSLACIVVAMS